MPPRLDARLPSPLVELPDDRLRDIRLLVKRDDLIDPHVPGNKWRKLKYNLAAARQQGFGRILTFGGAFSNHVRATAFAGRQLGFATVGVIRGEEHLPLNESLASAVRQGMTLTYLDRSTYRRKTEPEVIAALVDRSGPSASRSATLHSYSSASLANTSNDGACPVCAGHSSQ